MKKKIWFLSGFIGALALGAFANIPRAGSPTGSMAVTPEVSEIQTQRHSELSFDGDLKQLEAKQGRYRENLPHRQKVAMKKPAAKKPAAPAKRAKAKTKKI